MATETDSNNLDTPKQWSARVAVTGTQFQLPQFVAEETAFKSSRHTVKRGALVAWYYHEERDKAVLSNADLHHPALEYISSCRVSGVSNEEVESGDVSSGKVTIPADLPNDVYDRLVAADAVVLKVARVRQDEDTTTFASVYPAGDYDRGEPVDVTCEYIYTDKYEDDGDSPSNSTITGIESEFKNSI